MINIHSDVGSNISSFFSKEDEDSLRYTSQEYNQSYKSPKKQTCQKYNLNYTKWYPSCEKTKYFYKNIIERPNKNLNEKIQDDIENLPSKSKSLLTSMPTVKYRCCDHTNLIPINIKYIWTPEMKFDLIPESITMYIYLDKIDTVKNLRYKIAKKLTQLLRKHYGAKIPYMGFKPDQVELYHWHDLGKNEKMELIENDKPIKNLNLRYKNTFYVILLRDNDEINSNVLRYDDRARNQLYTDEGPIDKYLSVYLKCYSDSKLVDKYCIQYLSPGDNIKMLIYIIEKMLDIFGSFESDKCYLWINNRYISHKSLMLTLYDFNIRNKSTIRLEFDDRDPIFSHLKKGYISEGRLNRKEFEILARPNSWLPRIKQSQHPVVTWHTILK